MANRTRGGTGGSRQPARFQDDLIGLLSSSRRAMASARDRSAVFLALTADTCRLNHEHDPPVIDPLRHCQNVSHGRRYDGSANRRFRDMRTSAPWCEQIRLGDGDEYVRPCLRSKPSSSYLWIAARIGALLPGLRARCETSYINTFSVSRLRAIPLEPSTICERSLLRSVTVRDGRDEDVRHVAHSTESGSGVEVRVAQRLTSGAQILRRGSKQVVGLVAARWQRLRCLPTE